MKPELLVSSAATGFCLLTIIVFWNKLPPEIPLFYSKPWGQEQLAQTPFIFLPITVSLVFLAINMIIAKQMFNKEEFAKKILTLGSMTGVILAAVTTIKIVLLIK
jgi:hypothetical protein